LSLFCNSPLNTSGGRLTTVFMWDPVAHYFYLLTTKCQYIFKENAVKLIDFREGLKQWQNMFYWERWNL